MRALRQSARFDTGLSTAAEGIVHQLELMKARNVVITTDLPARRDGLPYSTASEPADPGVAVWWVERTGVERVMACDRWRKVRDNMRAIDASLEALRGLERWGASEIARRAMNGFSALPPGVDEEDPSTTWRDVLGGPWPSEMSGPELLVLARTRHHRLIRMAHPDLGGSDQAAAELNAALEAAEKELSATA